MFSTASLRLTSSLAFKHAKSKSLLLRQKPYHTGVRAFSSRNLSSISANEVTNAEEDKKLGYIEKPLKALDIAAVRQIKAELMAVDKNFDGRLDADELKVLLRKHNDAFTDEEILELSELFYIAKTGGSVQFDDFIQAIDEVASNSSNSGGKGVSPAERLLHFREGNQHPLGIGRCGVEFYGLGHPHGHYTQAELDVKQTHVQPKGFVDNLAYNAVQAVRYLFDSFTGWRNEVDKITATNVLYRVIFLETIAAVPGMVAAVVRHFSSLRNMKPDGGYMQLFLEEANNERMHLLTFVRMKDPSYLFRAAVIVSQFGFGAAFGLAYVISPRFCHRFVGYVEEEAVSTYTKIIKAIEIAPEGSEIGAWRTESPPKIAISYWKLGENGTVLDLMKAVRADEAEHRDVNHLVSGVKEGQINPLYDPHSKLDLMLTKYVQAVMTRPEQK